VDKQKLKLIREALENEMQINDIFPVSIPESEGIEKLMTGLS